MFIFQGLSLATPIRHNARSLNDGSIRVFHSLLTRNIHVGNMVCGGSGPVKVQPMAIILDGDALHRNIVVRLESLGFPVVWHSTDSHLKSSLRGTRARTPRHAVEIAYHLMIRSTSDSCLECKFGLKPFVGPSADDQVGTSRTKQSSQTSKNKHSIARMCKKRRMTTIIAVSGDAAFETALESLLAREHESPSAYVDRSLLSGSILLITGPLSEAVLKIATQRCERIGVLLVVATPEGKPSNARAGTLHLWCASESNMALEALTPVFRSLASSVQVVSNNVRDVSSARLARAIAPYPHADIVSTFCDNGASLAAVSAERRSLKLVKELAKAKQSPHETLISKRIATNALDFALEANTRAVHTMQQNHFMQQKLNHKNLQVRELVNVCTKMNQLMHSAAKIIDDVKYTNTRRRTTEYEIAQRKLSEEILENELVSAWVLLKKEIELHRSLKNKRMVETGAIKRLSHQNIVLGNLLTEQRDAMDAKNDVINNLCSSLTQESLSYSKIITGLYSQISLIASDVIKMQQAAHQVTLEKHQVEEEGITFRRSLMDTMKLERDFVKYRQDIEIDAADNASRLDCSTQNKWSAISHAKIIELDCMYLENSLQEAKRTIVAADSEDGKLHRVIESSHKELQVLKAQFEFDIAAANDEAENKVAAANRDRVEAEARSSKTVILLAECEKRNELENIRATKLSNYLAAMKTDVLLDKSKLQTKLTSAYDDINRLVHEVAQLEHEVSELHHTRERENSTSLVKDRKLSEAQAESETSEKKRIAAETRSFHMASDMHQLCDQLSNAKTTQGLVEVAVKQAREGLQHSSKEKTAASEACAALAEFNAKVAYLSYAMDSARSVRTRHQVEQHFQRTIKSAREEAVLHAALLGTKSRVNI